MLPPGVITAGENFLGVYGSVRRRDRKTTENSAAPATSGSGSHLVLRLTYAYTGI